uniref:Uncharacterized protein n=1 Tax=Heliothis virescens TaxID=7102 RepID=A0A2A4JC33_HELVI
MLNIPAASLDPSPRSVNVALETSFLFEPKDANENISFIKNIKDFLDKLYKILAPQAKQQQKFRSETEPKPERKFFFGFIKDAGEAFLNITSSKIEKAISVIKAEFTKRASDNEDILPSIAPRSNVERHHEDFNDLSHTNGDDIKESLRTMMEDEDSALGGIAKKMNQYYTEDEVKKMYKLLRKFTKYLEADMDTSKVVKEIFQVVFSDKFSSLNVTAQASLVKDFELLVEHMKSNKEQLNQQTTSKRVILPDVEVLFGEKLNTAKTTQPQMNASKDFRRSERKKIKKEEKKKANNEIIVDNLELIVKSLKP